MKLHELKPTPGSTHSKKRVGRGHGSGTGKTAGAGHKGQKARSGSSLRINFEGGQTPVIKRLRKVGFHNPNRKEFTTINLDVLNRYEKGTVVTPETLLKDKVIKNLEKAGLKVLGNGEVKQGVTVKAHKFSATAEAKIKAAGGQVEVI
jgi:large subunit ribosomal protein L15